MYIIIDYYGQNPEAIIKQTKAEVDAFLKKFPMAKEELESGTLRVFRVEEELYREYDSENEEGNRYE